MSTINVRRINEIVRTLREIRTTKGACITNPVHEAFHNCSLIDAEAILEALQVVPEIPKEKKYG
jgi:hypothetical protein